MLDEKRRLARNAKERAKYAANAEYRAAKIANHKQKYDTDPVWRATSRVEFKL